MKGSIWFLLFGLLPPQEDAATGSEPLFDGRTLDGWEVQGSGRFFVEDGEIRALADRKSFLTTRQEFGDFILEVETWVEPGGNSGIQFRSRAVDGRVSGYQAEVDTSDRRWAGGLYDEGRRGWLQPLKDQPEKQAAFRNGEWNRYRIHAEGDWLRVWVNGVLTTDYRDALSLRGVIGLQHHGESGKLYKWRNIQITRLGVSEFQPLFDGASTAGFESNGAGTWAVEDGVLVGRIQDDPRHGLLWSERSFGDFCVRCVFRSSRGNSGLYFRSELKDNAVGVAGFQAEIDPARDVGGLYETGGRAWVVKPAAELVAKCFKPGEWNTMTVSAHGGRILVHVNGHQTAELIDDPGRPEGRFALQLHGGQDVEVQIRELSLLETTPRER